MAWIIFCSPGNCMVCHFVDQCFGCFSEPGTDWRFQQVWQGSWKRGDQWSYWNTNIRPFKRCHLMQKNDFTSSLRFFRTCHGTIFWVLSGSSLRSKARDFRLTKSLRKHRTKRCLFPTTNWPLNLPKVGGPVLPGCWRMDVRMCPKWLSIKNIEGKGLMKTLNTVERKVLQFLIHLVWNDRSLQKLQGRSDKKYKKRSVLSSCDHHSNKKIHGPWCHDSFCWPIYKGFPSFTLRAWDFAMGNLIRDGSSSSLSNAPGNNKTSLWPCIHGAFHCDFRCMFWCMFIFYFAATAPHQLGAPHQGVQVCWWMVASPMLVGWIFCCCKLFQFKAKYWGLTDRIETSFVFNRFW